MKSDDDVAAAVIGVPVAGRDRQETHGLVGYFINTLPVRCMAVDGARFADMVGDASAATLAALDHSLLPIAMLSSKLRRFSLTEAPRMHVSFALSGKDTRNQLGNLKVIF